MSSTQQDDMHDVHNEHNEDEHDSGDAPMDDLGIDDHGYLDMHDLASSPYSYDEFGDPICYNE